MKTNSTGKLIVLRFFFLAKCSTHLKILLSVENDALGLYFSVFDIDFVAAQNDRDIFAYTNQVSMPIWYIFVGNTRCYIEHNNSALTLDVVTITKTTEFFLTGCNPQMKKKIGGNKWNRMSKHEKNGQCA